VSKESVKRFNCVAGNPPSQGDLWEVWKQLKMQAKLIREEGLEIFEATENEDFENLIKETMDVKYVLTYMEQLLEAFGVNVVEAFNQVCNNNDQKLTQSYLYASDSKEALEDKGITCYVEETNYNGETWYTVRDDSGKVRKLKHYQSCDLSHLVPQEFR